MQTKIGHHEDIKIFIDANETTQNTKEENILSITSLINNLGLINLTSTLPKQHKYRKMVDLFMYA